jgi:glycosyltransferase involved in cell wall biosynthesis
LAAARFKLRPELGWLQAGIFDRRNTTMHVLFVHQNFPAQFGHIAHHLIQKHDYRCSFISERPPGESGGIERIQYRANGGATERTHFCSRTFENQIWHSQAAFESLQSREDLRPDLVVGHSGFVSTLFLRELYDCPMINYFEYFYRPRNSDFDFRHDLPQPDTLHALRARARNAMLLLDLENCDAGYSPTHWQRDQLPNVYHNKVQTIFDGIDTSIWRPRQDVERRVGSWSLPDDVRIITYVSRGMESMRGFDIFMRVAKRICEERKDVVFVVVGEDRIAYGGDKRFTGGKTFKQWVLAQDDYDLNRILFAGRIRPAELANLFSLSDLHIYLTVPFVLSWSLMNALACSTTVLASDTPPVQEMIRHETNGLLVNFFDVDGFVDTAHRVLDDPAAFRHLGQAGQAMIRDRYSLDVCLPQMVALYEQVC